MVSSMTGEYKSLGVRIIVEGALAPNTASEAQQAVQEALPTVLGDQMTGLSVRIELADQQPEFAPEIEEQLDLSLWELVNRHYPNNDYGDLAPKTTIGRAISGVEAKAGVKNLRHILAMGENRLCDAHFVGSSSIDVFRRLSQQVDPSLVLKTAPDYDDIARVCPTLSHVPAGVFERCPETLTNRSVQELLDMDLETLQGLYGDTFRRSTEKFYYEIRAFEHQFLKAHITRILNK
jgi:hypothetical protein